MRTKMKSVSRTAAFRPAKEGCTPKEVETRQKCVVGGVLLLCAPIALQAADWSFEPAASVASGYESNPALTTDPHDSASSVTIFPRGNLRRKTETSEANIGLLAKATYYSSSEYEDTLEGQLSFLSVVQSTERAKLGLNGIWRHDSLFEAAAIDPATSNIQDVDIGLVTKKVRRDWRELQPSVAYATTERSAVTLRYRLTDVKFDNAVGTDLVDYQQHYVSGTYSYNLTAVSDLLVVVDGSQFRPAAGTESDTLGLSAGISHKFSPTLSSSIVAGVGRTTETLTNGGNVDSDTFRLQGQAKQQSELSTLDAVISRDVQPSGIGRSVSTDQMRAYWDRQLSQFGALVVRLTVFRNKALEGSDPSLDRRYAEAEVGLRWILARPWAVHVAYQYRYQKYDLGLDDATSNGVFVALQWVMPR